MRDELLRDAVAAVDKARRAGADDVWALVRRSRDVSYQVSNGKLEEVKDSTARSLWLRLFVNGRYSTHSTTDLRLPQVEAFIRQAVALTRALQRDPHRVMVDPKLFRGRPAGDLDLVDRAVGDLEAKEREARCRALDEAVRGAERLIEATSVVMDKQQMIAAASSNGFADGYETTTLGQWTEITLEDEGDQRANDWNGAWLRRAPLPEPSLTATEALARARMRLGSKKGETKNTTMVVENRAAAQLVGRLLSPAHGQLVQQERSFWGKRLGQSVVNEALTIVDDPTVVGALGSRPFDGEGIAAKPLALIEQGRLRNLYLDTYYAKKLGKAVTTGSPSNRIVKPGTKGQAAIVSEVQDGVFVTSWLGGNMDSTTGDFSYGLRGHVIRGGRVAEPVGEMNVSGNIAQLFSRLALIGNDPWPYSSTLVPTLAFTSVQFSGV